ncbi:MAG: sulfate ABC transporter permease [Victivallales bacterium]|nr:sulfate ABC transporter permease [Victivallales bacterium]
MKKVRPFSPNTADAPWLKSCLIAFAVLVVLVIVVLPFASVIVQAFSEGPSIYLTLLRSSDMQVAVLLSLKLAAIAVPLNAIFGILLVWGMTHTQLPCRRFIMALLDLPFSVSPVVVGLLFIMLLGKNAPLGGWLEEHGVQVIFAFPGLLLATIFVTLPFVARELLPLMEGQYRQEEEAARLLGAGWWRIFLKITLPEIKWGLLFSIILSLARALGEYGAVAVVSGNIRGKTNTLPLHIEALFNDYELTAANAAATLLALLGVITLTVRIVAELKKKRDSNEH